MDALAILYQNPIAAPVLSFPCCKVYLTIETDACNKQIGCVLMQLRPDGAKKPPWCWSGTLNAKGKNYDTTHCEPLAVFWAILFLRFYLEGQRFKICTDHDAFIWILNLTVSIRRLARCSLPLSELDFEVLHRAEIKNEPGDALSQLEKDGTEKTLL